MISDHHDHEHEGEAAGAVPLTTRVDELLRSGGHRQREQRTDDARGASPTSARIRRTMVRPSSVRSRRPGRAPATGPAFAAFGGHLVLLPPVEGEETEDEEDQRDEEGDERRDPQRAEVAGEDHVAGGRAVGGAALGRQRRQAERLLDLVATSQNCTTAYCGVWVNSPFQNCGLLPPISQVWRIMYSVTSSNLAKRLSSGVYSTVGVDDLGDQRGVDRGLHVGRLGGLGDVRLRSRCRGRRWSSPRRAVDDLLHLPLRDPALERVERRRGGEPQEGEDHHEAGERR